MDEEQLTVQMVEQLIKYMPEPEQMKQLEAFKDEFDTLAEPEQFGVVVSHLVPWMLFLSPVLFLSLNQLWHSCLPQATLYCKLIDLAVKKRALTKYVCH